MPVASLDWLLSPWGLGLLGLCVGSFLNVVVYRLPLMMERQWWGDVAQQLADDDSHQRVFGHAAPAALPQGGSTLAKALEGLPRLSLSHPASHCPACNAPIRWHQNIPLLGWLRLRGRCAACDTRIAARYPLVELATGLLFAAMGWRFGEVPVALLWCGVMAVLLALALIDWDTTVLPDAMTLPLLWAGLLAAVAGWTVPLDIALWGAVAGYLSLWSVYWLFKLVTGKEGMGHGDFKLLGALGAWLGWQGVLPVVLMASVLGVLVGIVMKLTNQLREGRYVPFGPFLAGGGVVVVLAGLPRVLAVMGWQ